MFRIAVSMIMLFSLLTVPFKVYSAFLYKSYTIRYDRGWDVLCDPYVVQKNDWVLKIFKQRGEIAHQDFPEFLRIFKRINPHIRDINRIRPGQHIMIPLRKLKQGTFPGQSSGIVTIPFVTISNIPETVNTHSSNYEVQKGDCVSVLISKNFGTFGSQAYQEGIKLFKLVNPHIENLDRIYTGQTIHIPNPSIRNQPWYPSLFDSVDATGDAVLSGDAFPTGMQASAPPMPSFYENQRQTPLAAAASILNARLLDQGEYYFPRPGQEDFALDLAKLPIMELKDGTRFVFSQDADRLQSEIKIVKSHWNNLKIIPVAPDAPAEQVFNSIFASLELDPKTDRLAFSDQGVEVEARGKWIFDQPSASGNTHRKVCVSLIDSPDQVTPESIRRYLEQHDIIIKDVLSGKGSDFDSAKPPTETMGAVLMITPFDHRSLVKELLRAMDYQYAPNVSISFPYAGVQVNAVTNLVAKRGQSPLLVDYGDFYGDAIAAIKKSGFDIIQINKQDNFYTIVQKLLTALKVSYSNNPRFWAAKRSAVHNTNLTIPGFLVNRGDAPKVLLSGAPLHDGIIQMLRHQGVRVIMLHRPENYS